MARSSSRRSPRLEGFDYTQDGAYFVTVCSQDRECLFGEVVDGGMFPNPAGRMVETWWHELAGRFAGVEADEMIVMPNHLHGVLFLGTPPSSSTSVERPALPKLLQWFKTMTTNQYIRQVSAAGWPPFAGRLWQRSYFERIVRGPDGLDRVREYIRANPARWMDDEENPAAKSR